jgi:hypothetical protein
MALLLLFERPLSCRQFVAHAGFSHGPKGSGLPLGDCE